MLHRVHHQLGYADGQTVCDRELLIGEWKQIKSLWGEYANTDSLKTLIESSNRTIGTFRFSRDGTSRYTFLDETRQRIKHYSLDSESCEIILGTKRKQTHKAKTRNRSNLEILYLDQHILIFKEDNNPKGYATHLLVKSY